MLTRLYLSDYVGVMALICASVFTYAKSIVNIRTSLSHQLTKNLPTTLSNTQLCFVGKNVRIFCITKDSHIFPTKNNRICKIYVRNFNETLTNDAIIFEQLPQMFS